LHFMWYNKDCQINYSNSRRSKNDGVCGQALPAEGHFITPVVLLGCRQRGTVKWLLYTVVCTIVISVKFPNTVSQLLQETLNTEHSWFIAVPDLLVFCSISILTLSNPIFLPPAYSPALIYFGWERGWWITCNYPTVLKEKNRNRKSTTCASCWLTSVLH
jgi:hypothetical protein